MKPKLFVASSNEARGLAAALKTHLEDCVETKLWYEGFFGLSEYTLEALLRDESDFAAFIFAADDSIERRGELLATPRDNVVLEFGLSVGLLGRERCFILAPAKITPPTDIAGLTIAYYDAKDKCAASAMKLCADQIRAQIDRLTHDGSARETQRFEQQWQRAMGAVVRSASADPQKQTYEQAIEALGRGGLLACHTASELSDVPDARWAHGDVLGQIGKKAAEKLGQLCTECPVETDAEALGRIAKAAVDALLGLAKAHPGKHTDWVRKALGTIEKYWLLGF